MALSFWLALAQGTPGWRECEEGCCCIPGPLYILQVPMASERRKVKYHWSSTSERCTRKRSCLGETGDVAPSRRPAHSSASRSGGASSPKRLKAQKEDHVACTPRLSWDSARRRNSSSHSSGPGVDGSAFKSSLSRGTGDFLSSGGSLRPANPSLEEMASLQEEACSLKVGGCNALRLVKPSPHSCRCWEWEFEWEEAKKRSL